MRITQNSWSSLLRSEISSHLTIPSVGTSLNRSPGRRRRVLSSLAAAPTLLFLLLAAATAFGHGSATWNLNPPEGGCWDGVYCQTNWTPASAPNGPEDTATFDVSNTTNIIVDDQNQFVIEVNGIVFNAGASAFTIDAPGSGSLDFTLTISGVGITNNSGITQNFVTNSNPDGGAVIQFTNSATAGSLTVFTNNPHNFSGGSGGVTIFFDTSTAGNGIFANNAALASGVSSGTTAFVDSATAHNATLIANGSAVSGASGGTTTFQSTSTAGNAMLIANGGSGGGLGGNILFGGDSTGGTARTEVFGNGNLDISAHNAPGVTVGSIEGSGVVFLGARNLSVGSNNLSTIFSGVIQGDGGSLTKIGTGQLNLTAANSYTGGTTISAGTLLVKNKSGTGTGTGAVQVNTGTLGGTGIIAGAVTVGTGTSSGAILLPGNSAPKPGTLTMNSALIFNPRATYTCVLNRGTPKASKVVALGVTIKGKVPFTFVDTGTGTLATGTVFTVIRNTAASPISGTFSNLADGAVFTSNGNNFQANYEGGDGNDLTLTVVP
jgi:autotransporter-associated beta strand protein